MLNTTAAGVESELQKEHKDFQEPMDLTWNFKLFTLP